MNEDNDKKRKYANESVIGYRNVKCTLCFSTQATAKRYLLYPGYHAVGFVQNDGEWQVINCPDCGRISTMIYCWDEQQRQENKEFLEFAV